eukprot:3266531-Lingulodinium_polyedra.AAC.1
MHLRFARLLVCICASSGVAICRTQLCSELCSGKSEPGAGTAASVSSTRMPPAAQDEAGAADWGCGEVRRRLTCDNAARAAGSAGNILRALLAFAIRDGDEPLRSCGPRGAADAWAASAGVRTGANPAFCPHYGNQSA